VENFCFCLTEFQAGLRSEESAGCQGSYAEQVSILMIAQCGREYAEPDKSPNRTHHHDPIGSA